MDLLIDQDRLNKQLAELFHIMDLDDSGELTIDEIADVLLQRETQAYLQSLGISVTDAWTLLKLLDTDGSGTVNRQEFVNGCLALRGDAKAVHIATLAYDQQIMVDMLEEFIS